MSTESGHSADLQIQPGSLDQLRWFAAGGFLFALLDGSGSEPTAWAQLRRLDDRVVPLIHFPGYKKDASVPHLVQVDPATLEWMVAKFWQQPWGIFALAQSDLEHIRLHFRRFLLVQLPNGESRYFRFYDPRVLSMYLQHCMTWELQKFFGPVRGFAISNPDNEDIWIVQGAAPADPPVTSDINDRPTNPRQSLLWQIREEQLRALESASA